MRPSPLYKRLGLTGPADRLVQVVAGDQDLSDEVYSIRSVRGGSDLSNYTASTLTVETPINVPPAQGGRDFTVKLDPSAASLIGAQVYEDPEKFSWRYRGRLATQTAHDGGDGHGNRWKSTDLVGAAWASLYQNAPDTFTPTGGTTLQQAAQALFLPSWAPFATLEWSGTPEEWPDPEPGETHDPITARELLSILSQRLYMLGDTRQGHFRVAALDYMEADAADAAENLWPLARAHCLAPTTWDQGSSYPTEYLLTFLMPSGAVVEYNTTPDGTPPGITRLVAQDWSNIVRTTQQWRRILGLRWETYQDFWRLPSLTVRLDHLISSKYEGHRRAAGMLLRLNVGDPVPLAGDWPISLDGIHFVSSVQEVITSTEWSLTLGLKSYRALAGQLQLPVPPRTWAQAGPRTWTDAGTATWNEGVPV